jgi:hypothetical protein
MEEQRRADSLRLMSECVSTSRGQHTVTLYELSEELALMDAAVVHDQDAARAGEGVHLGQLQGHNRQYGAKKSWW